MAPRHFAWQAWHLLTSTLVLRGTRGTHETGLDLVARLGPVSCPWRCTLCVAGVALGCTKQTDVMSSLAGGAG